MKLGSVEIAGVSNRAQDVMPGDAFVAIRGQEADGHRWIAQAVERGAACVVAERAVPAPVPVLRVRNSRRVYARLASRLHGHPSRQLVAIGVTGTNGKSTTAHLLRHLLGPAACGLVGTTGADTLMRHHPPGLTTPDSLALQAMLAEMVQAGARYAVLEVSSHASHQHRVDGVRFQAGVWTNLAVDHLDYHGSFAAYRDAKGRFLASVGRSGRVILNADDPHFAHYWQQVRGQVISCGRGTSAHVRLRSLQTGPKGMELVVSRSGPAGMGRLRLKSRLVGEHQVPNILAALAAALPFVRGRELARRVASFGGVWRRMQVISRAPVWVIDDCAHNPASYRAVLHAAGRAMPGNGRFYLIHGVRGGRGSQVAGANGRVIGRWCRWHRACWVATLCQESAGPGDQVKPEELHAHERARRRYGRGVAYRCYATRLEAMRYAVRHAEPGDAVLLLGPHPMDDAADVWRREAASLVAAHGAGSV